MLKNTLEAFSHAVLDKMEKKKRSKMEQKTKETIKRAIRHTAELLFWFGIGTAAFFAVFYILRYVKVWN